MNSYFVSQLHDISPSSYIWAHYQGLDLYSNLIPYLIRQVTAVGATADMLFQRMVLLALKAGRASSAALASS